ncbi:MAG: competence/damage-inducible protein A [Vicinamibacterales bacterium]
MSRAPVAAVLAVGSELLALGRADTNSPFIAAALQRHGIAVSFTAVVTDDREALLDAMRHALTRADLVVTTGGLGPTDDDRTRDCAADVLGLSMHEDAEVVAAIRERFGRRGLAMPEINRRQAQVPAGATIVANARGTAPGLWIPAGGRAMLLLPGPPREMTPMLQQALDQHVAPRFGGGVAVQRAIVIAGRSESWVDEIAQPLYRPWGEEAVPITTTILASLGTVELHLSAYGPNPEAVAARLDAAQATLAARFGDDVVNLDGASLEASVGAALAERGWTVAAAESCTGGLVTTRLTDVAGSSRYVERAVVTYSNEAKTAVLGVPAELIAAHGAVSEPVAVAMAEGLRARAGVTVTVAVTGIAGPGGGTADKPVGLVCFAVSGPAGTRVKTSRFSGDRTVIRSLAATTALDLVRRYVAGSLPG